MTATQLYDRDFFQWTQHNAALLRSGRFDQADVENIAEEIHALGLREHRELESRMVLLQHLLRWRTQSNAQSGCWRLAIEIQRIEIQRVLMDMPSLRLALAADLSETYYVGVLKASIATGLPEDRFPASCPFTLDQILDEEFLPA